MQHEHLRVGLGHLGAHAEGQAHAHGAERAGVEPVAGHVGRDGLAAEVQDLLAVDDQDGVAPHEVAHLLAEAQRVDRHLVRCTSPCPARRPSRRRACAACRSRPRSAWGRSCPRASARSCSSTARASPAIGHVDRAVVAELGGVDVDVDHLEVGGEARRPAELDHPVEARADRQHDVGLGEGLAARVEEGQRVVLRDQAARDRRGVERDAGGLDEGLERGGAVGPPHAAARDDHRALRLREQRDGLRTAPGSPSVRGAGFQGPAVVQLLLLDLLAEDVARHVEVDRAGPAGRWPGGTRCPPRRGCAGRRRCAPPTW